MAHIKEIWRILQTYSTMTVLPKKLREFKGEIKVYCKQENNVTALLYSKDPMLYCYPHSKNHF